MVTLLLDFDGVVNANKPKWHAPPRTKWVHADGEAFKIRWAPALVDEINELSKTLDVLWASTWIPWKFVLEHTLGFRKFECIDWPTEHVESFAKRWHLKETAARKVLESGELLIWADDDLPEIGPLLKEFKDQLLIRPKSNTGLTPEDIDRMKEYANQHR